MLHAARGEYFDEYTGDAELTQTVFEELIASCSRHIQRGRGAKHAYRRVEQKETWFPQKTINTRHPSADKDEKFRSSTQKSNQVTPEGKTVLKKPLFLKGEKAFGYKVPAALHGFDEDLHQTLLCFDRRLDLYKSK